MKRVRAVFISPLFILGLPLLSACGEMLTTLKLTGTDPFLDREWSATTYLEPDPDLPSDAATPAVQGFEGVQIPGEDDFWLAASFFNRASLQYQGYARRYQPGRGWASIGEDFKVVASVFGYSMGAAQIAADTSGGVLAAFFTLDDGGDPSTQVVTSYRSSTWENEIAVIYAERSFPGPSNESELVPADYGFTPGLPMDLWISSDRPGTGALLVAQESSAPVLWSAYWNRTSGLDSVLLNSSKELQGLMLDGKSSPLEWVEDDAGNLCALHENAENESSSSVINSHCLVTGSLTSGSYSDVETFQETFTPALDSGVDASISGGNEASLFAVAKDGQGTLVVVFFRMDDDGSSQLVSRERIDGVWSDELVQITTSVTGSYQTPQDIFIPVRPALTSLGEGRFLVVWPGYLMDDGMGTLFYSIRDSGGGWTRPKSVGVTLLWDEAEGPIADDSRTALDGLWLFSNGDGEAALAVRYFGDDADASTVDDIPRRWVFARFSDELSEWDTFAARGRPGYEDNELVGCVASDAGMSPLHCTTPPSGAVFSDGSAVIVFPTEDNDQRARLGTVVFE